MSEGANARGAERVRWVVPHWAEPIVAAEARAGNDTAIWGQVWWILYLNPPTSLSIAQRAALRRLEARRVVPQAADE